MCCVSEMVVISPVSCVVVVVEGLVGVSGTKVFASVPDLDGPCTDVLLPNKND